MRRQEDLPTIESEPSTHQQFEVLPQAPPLPIIDIAREFMAEQQNIDNVTYIDSVLESSNATTIPDETPTNGTSFLRRDHLKVEVIDSTGMSPIRRSPLNKRQQKRQCDPSTPCPDGSCCRRDGRCGFDKENCDSSVCISNCGATALCGRDSKGGTVKCPLNVCCSYYGESLFSVPVVQQFMVRYGSRYWSQDLSQISSGSIYAATYCEDLPATVSQIKAETMTSAPDGWLSSRGWTLKQSRLLRSRTRLL
jgi:hypothetical protein